MRQLVFLYLRSWPRYISCQHLDLLSSKQSWAGLICLRYTTMRLQGRRNLCESKIIMYRGSFNNLIYRPESLGLVAASIYILSLILFIPFAFSKPIIESTGKKSPEGITVVEFPHYQVCPTSNCQMTPSDFLPSSQCIYLRYSLFSWQHY